MEDSHAAKRPAPGSLFFCDRGAHRAVGRGRRQASAAHPDQRPEFVSVYFEQADVAGHSYGPDSLQVQEALVTVDAALKRLVDGLRQRNLYDATNLA
jgi:predicted AlkP superfamily pyrophosphatase or phosphodiesterase